MEMSFVKLMDERTHNEWVQLATHVLLARSTPNCSAANDKLEPAAELGQ